MVKEKEANNTIGWKAVRKGWEYNIWQEVGNRGGLCEAQEILLLENEGEKKAPIEAYVQLYRELMEKQVPIANVFDRFAIKVKASRKKEGVKDYILERFDEYEMEQVGEDEETIYFEKDITTAEQLEKITIGWKEDTFSFEMFFTEKEVLTSDVDRRNKDGQSLSA
ncbi:hypothetical protein PP175_26010 (plasmid) [Aneurinibacillus sp. Ricciae_BoGa-3]|uniref:hypothetical protein n=1 Tax=Aneurinibacillus sp. Ricciae_BoGa-3 TaxID=3022697 RepID=UPI002340CB14|nr:hypothetical protein [Aneurinibacillus sp. Ricciae_BoGa-3]WCK57522.1 hypothetical protein PP175_26010 [Aneurinibacillus sp. Ricciae_BoGa-3]